MKFHGIDMRGKFHVQRVASLPPFEASDKGRIIFVESSNQLYYGTDTEWKTDAYVADELTKADIESALTGLVTSHYHNTFNGTLQNVNELYQDLGSKSGAISINLTLGNVVSVTINGNCAFTFSGTSSGLSRTWIMRMANAGSYSVTWPASVKWPKGTAPELTPIGKDMIVFNSIDNGTTWFANAILDIK